MHGPSASLHQIKVFKQSLHNPGETDKMCWNTTIHPHWVGAVTVNGMYTHAHKYTQTDILDKTQILLGGNIPEYLKWLFQDEKGK